jgi:hypothetical protein
MRPLLGLLLTCALLLSGCGGDDDGTASDPASSSPTVPAPSSGTTTQPGGGSDAGATLLALVSQSAVGGEVDTTAVPLDSDEAIGEFTAQFEGDQMQQSIQQALSVAAVPDGQQVMGAVIAIGCETPENAAVTRADDGSVVITAKGGGKSTQECLVPVTTVALVAVPQADA